jgi:uncharacterized protein with FMN-binding domain
MKHDHRLPRLVLGTTGTLAGVALLLSVKPAEPGAAGPADALVRAVPTSNTAAAPAAGKPAASEPHPPKTPIQRTVSGDDGQTERNHGALRVRVTVAAGRVVAASGTQDATSAKSRTISGEAISKLDRMALAAQNASLDSISGATYTTNAYEQSLQSALDKSR